MTWGPGGREKALEQIAADKEVWDILIIGGGITGAGIFNEASRLGQKVLLVEQKDFAWGTSSRSSKMIHGGLRYLLQGDLILTWHSAREREYLVKKYAGLIQPLSFLLPVYQGHFPGKRTLLAGLTLYDFLAGHRNHSYWEREKLLQEVPHLNSDQLLGAAHFVEATTDDAGLVLRILQEGTNDRALPVNYVAVKKLDSDKMGAVLQEMTTGREFHIQCRLIINATGVFADRFRQDVMTKPHLRPLRGSHLTFAQERLPLQHSVTIFHPDDKRPIFAYPWAGITLVGTTDLDDKGNLSLEPTITSEEVTYLLKGLHQMFPKLDLQEKDVMSTFAGLRPVVTTGKKKKPSQERRDTAIWFEDGLLTVTGGKLTTFRLTAHQALKKARSLLPHLKLRPLEHHAEPMSMGENDLQSLAKNEAVVHLEDLLLRRTRVGLTESDGGAKLFPHLRAALGWNEEKWKIEEQAYSKLWKEHYSLPGRMP